MVVLGVIAIMVLIIALLLFLNKSYIYIKSHKSVFVNNYEDVLF